MTRDLGDGATIEELGIAEPDSGTSGRSWASTIVATTGMTMTRPDLWVVALAGFVARGGILVFALPIWVLPTPIGVSAFIGADAITSEGPSERLIVWVALALTAVLAAVVAGAVVGALADVVLEREAEGEIERRAGGPAPGRPAGAVHPSAWRMVGRVSAIRLFCLLPLAAAVAWAAPRIGQATYHELILPDDLATPLAIRSLLASRDALAVVVAFWLASELIGGLAVRRALLHGASMPGALGGALVEVFRRPLAAVGTFLLGLTVAVAAILPAVVLLMAAWDLARGSLVAATDPLAMMGGSLLLVGTFVGGLLVAGAVSTWRSLGQSWEAARYS